MTPIQRAGRAMGSAFRKSPQQIRKLRAFFAKRAQQQGIIKQRQYLKQGVHNILTTERNRQEAIQHVIGTGGKALSRDSSIKFNPAMLMDMKLPEVSARQNTASYLRKLRKDVGPEEVRSYVKRIGKTQTSLTRSYEAIGRKGDYEPIEKLYPSVKRVHRHESARDFASMKKRLYKKVRRLNA